jgi:hypothetical protein
MLSAQELGFSRPVRHDPFADLIRALVADPDNPYNLERYLWVLEEPPPRECGHCGRLFDSTIDYRGELAKGKPRLYCSPSCSNRAAWRRRTERAAA